MINMNYDRFIIELLDRVAVLEEKVLKLEKLIAEKDEKILEHEQNNNSELKDKAYNKTKDKINDKTRDKTRYMFEGHQCLKNKLVWRVVKKYISENNWVSFEDLKRTFPDYLQGSFGVIREISTIDPKSIRYFMYDGKDPEKFKVGKEIEVLTLSDGTEIVVSNQWVKDNIKNFIKVAEALGYKIEEVNYLGE